MSLLEIKQLTVSYPGNPVFEDLDLTVERGEIVAVVGTSGGGKSTLLRAIMGLLPGDGTIQNGSICYDGVELTKLPEKEYRKLRGSRIGMIFQDAGASLCPVQTIGVQLYESVRAHGKCTKREVRKKALEKMEALQLSDGERILKSYPFELSGGMNQRIGVLLAAYLKPELLLADEPTSALDEKSKELVLQELFALREQSNTAVILVTHDLAFAARAADRICEICDGQLSAWTNEA